MSGGRGVLFEASVSACCQQRLACCWPAGPPSPEKEQARECSRRGLHIVLSLALAETERRKNFTGTFWKGSVSFGFPPLKKINKKMVHPPTPLSPAEAHRTVDGAK